MPTGQLDPFSPEFARDPAPCLCCAAGGAAISRAPFGLWLLSRFADVAAAALHPRLVRTLDAPPEVLAARKRAANWHDMPFHARFVQFSLLDSDGAGP